VCSKNTDLIYLIYENKKLNKNKITSDDDWGEPNSMETEDNNFTMEEILDMPIQSDLILEDKTSNVDTIPMNPVKIITIKKKEQNKEIPLEVKIQQYADDLYEQHGYGTEYEKSIFIVELAEKFPGLNDYEKYYDSAKKYHEMSI